MEQVCRAGTTGKPQPLLSQSIRHRAAGRELAPSRRKYTYLNRS
jgi:hypothetical protein